MGWECVGKGLVNSSFVNMWCYLQRSEWSQGVDEVMGQSLNREKCLRTGSLQIFYQEVEGRARETSQTGITTQSIQPRLPVPPNGTIHSISSFFLFVYCLNSAIFCTMLHSLEIFLLYQLLPKPSLRFSIAASFFSPVALLSTSWKNVHVSTQPTSLHE